MMGLSDLFGSAPKAAAGEAPKPQGLSLSDLFGVAQGLGTAAMRRGAEDTGLPGVNMTMNAAAAAPQLAGGLVSGAVDAARLPGDVYTGKTDPTSEEGIGRAFNLAGFLGGGGLTVPKPANSLGIFGGRRATTANHAVADLSEAALAKGATDRQVFDAGGWFPGVDRKMRFEIPDLFAVYTGKGKTVGEALDHPALFAAYPELSQIPFQKAEMDAGNLGRFDGKSIVINRALSEDQAKSTLLHELQHSVQDKENFARGGNTGDTARGANSDERMSSYKGLSGEVEARNVETRRNMTAEQLLSTPPWQTMDTPHINQNPQFTITDGSLSGIDPPRLLNDKPLTAEQSRHWLYGGFVPGGGKVPSIEGSGFFYPEHPNVQANSAADIRPLSKQPAWLRSKGYDNEAAMSLGRVEPAGGGFTAFHGSPYSFERFSTSKIGEGEGAQVFGHGLYFADDENVARAYRDALRLKAPDGKGSMYEVQIGSDPAHFIDYDAPLSQQSETVRNMIAKTGADPHSYAEFHGHEGEPVGQHIYGAIENEVARRAIGDATLPSEVMYDPRNLPVDAVKMMQEHGVPGVRYLDGGSRADGAGTRNYVVFDDKTIEILRKYGLAGLGIGGGAALGLSGIQPGQAQAAPSLGEMYGR